jgi:NDP-sugar pyrophosphorylase family protein
MINTVEFKTLHDNGNILCFIGNSHITKEMFEYFNAYRACEQRRYEDILTQDLSWVNNRQFIVLANSTQFKKTVVDGLSHLAPNYFSIYSTTNHLADITVGKGVLIHAFNLIADGVIIGDHTVITDHTILSQRVIVKDFCHISPFSQILVSTVGTGCYLAARTSIVGTQANPTIIADYCNFIIGSTVTKNITSPGTYFGNRQLNKLTSLDTKID